MPVRSAVARSLLALVVAALAAGSSCPSAAAMACMSIGPTRVVCDAYYVVVDATATAQGVSGNLSYGVGPASGSFHSKVCLDPNDLLCEVGYQVCFQHDSLYVVDESSCESAPVAVLWPLLP